MLQAAQDSDSQISAEPHSDQVNSAPDTKAAESKPSSPTRSAQSHQDHRSEGNYTVPGSSAQSRSENGSQQQHDTSDVDFVKALVSRIMTKATAEAKGVAAETKEAEKLAASAAKSPKPKDEIALKKGTTGEHY